MTVYRVDLSPPEIHFCFKLEKTRDLFVAACTNLSLGNGTAVRVSTASLSLSETPPFLAVLQDGIGTPLRPARRRSRLFSPCAPAPMAAAGVSRPSRRRRMRRRAGRSRTSGRAAVRA